MKTIKIIAGSIENWYLGEIGSVFDVMEKFYGYVIVGGKYNGKTIQKRHAEVLK